MWGGAGVSVLVCMRRAVYEVVWGCFVEILGGVACFHGHRAK